MCDDVGISRQAHQDVASVVWRNRVGPRSRVSANRKIRTRNQFFVKIARDRNRRRCHFVHRPTAEVDTCQRLLDMQFPGQAVRSQAVPVEQPKRQVAGLLNLGQHDSLADRVDRSRGNEQEIAGSDFDPMQTLLDGSPGKCLAQFDLGDARLQTGKEATACLGRKDHPGFSLAMFSGNECLSLFVVGMHLHRKAVMGIKEFDEQGKLRSSGVPPQKFRRSFSHESSQRPTVVITPGYEALVCPMIADLPAFGVVIAVGDGFAEQFPEPATSPANASQNGSAFERSQAGQSQGVEDDWQPDGRILACGIGIPSKNLFTQRARAWYSRPAKLKDLKFRFSILVLIFLRAIQSRAIQSHQETVMRESSIELSHVDLSVGDSVRLDDQILTVLDISQDEVTFRFDAIDDLESDNPETGSVVCHAAEGKRLPPR